MSWFDRLWLLVGMVMVVLVAGALAVPGGMGWARPTASAQAAKPAVGVAGPLTRPDEASAHALAVSSGQAVEVDDLGTETQVVMANPDGTFELRQHARPFRVRRGTGWVPVNTDLVVRDDGSVGPDAALTDLSFSGGGSGPLVRMVQDGKAMSLGWPAALPTPVLHKNVATYPEVWPGVDLKVRAGVTGFSELLVVKTAAAAANPALARLAFPTHTDGVSLQLDADGNVSAVDELGSLVFHAPRPAMWDAAASDSQSSPGTGGTGADRRRSG